jgi:MFS family permease
MTFIPMSLFNLLSSMSSTTVAPALQAIATDLDISSQTLVVMIVSVYLIGTALVPLVAAPISEMYGRAVVLSSLNIFYIIFNTLCGISATQNELLAFRFLAGLGGAGPYGVRDWFSVPYLPANADPCASALDREWHE